LKQKSNVITKARKWAAVGCVLAGVTIAIAATPQDAAAATKKAGFEKWWLGLTVGIVTVIFGHTISFNPVISIFAITTLIGISLLIVGIFNVVLSFDIRKVHKYEAAVV